MVVIVPVRGLFISCRISDICLDRELIGYIVYRCCIGYCRPQVSKLLAAGWIGSRRPMAA